MSWCGILSVCRRIAFGGAVCSDTEFTIFEAIVLCHFHCYYYSYTTSKYDIMFSE
jgi:hypothetical protein